MGFNTTVHILNDAWHIIKEHPEEFVAGIDELEKAIDKAQE